jgi:hypothetical protein
MLTMASYGVPVPEETKYVSIVQNQRWRMETGLFCPPFGTLATHKEGNFGFSISPDSFSTIIAKAFFWYLEKVSNKISEKGEERSLLVCIRF